MVKHKIPITREKFLQLTLPARLQLWAENRELEDYILTKAFTYKVTAAKLPIAHDPLLAVYIPIGDYCRSAVLEPVVRKQVLH